MRLTVHVDNAKKMVVEKNTKKGPVKKKIILNTFSYNDVEESQVGSILSQIEADGLGTPTKHYLSNEKIPGRSRKKKK